MAEYRLPRPPVTQPSHITRAGFGVGAKFLREFSRVAQSEGVCAAILVGRKCTTTE